MVYMIIGTNLVMPNQTRAVYSSHQYNECFNPDFIHVALWTCMLLKVKIYVNKYKIWRYGCFQAFFINTVSCFHRVWQLFNEYVRLILTLSKPDAQESNLSRAKLKSVPSLIRYVNTCKRMDAMCLTLPRTFSVRISERLSAHLPFQNNSTPDIN